MPDIAVADAQPGRIRVREYQAEGNDTGGVAGDL
jgi:hypothetical protein